MTTEEGKQKMLKLKIAEEVKRVQIHPSIDIDLVQRLELIASDNKMSVSRTVEELLKLGIQYANTIS